MSCFIPFGKAAKTRAIKEENEWLKTMLAREQQQRQQAQAEVQEQQRSVHEYQLKCALLEAEVVHAAQAAHELGDHMCMFLARAEQAQRACSPACALEATAPTTPWSLYTTKRPALPASSPDCAATPRIAAIRDQGGGGSSACRAFELTPRGSHSVEPLRMQERMARLSVHLKSMAAQWRARLETCGPHDQTEGGLADQQPQQAAHDGSAAARAPGSADSSSPSGGGRSRCSGNSIPGHNSDGGASPGSALRYGSSSGRSEGQYSPCSTFDITHLGRALDEAAGGAHSCSSSSGSSSRAGSVHSTGEAE